MASILLLGGCSTLEVRDTYRSVGEQSTFLEYKNDDVTLSAIIEPDTRFYSIGVFGLPIIPTYFKISSPTEISLVIRLTLRNEHNFSFLPQPCLIVENSKALCPYRLDVSALGQYQDDGTMYSDKQKRWQKISSFYNTASMIVNPSTTPAEIRVDRSRIYQHYGYTGAQAWGHLNVTLTYRYNCGGGCPERLKVDANNLVTIENYPMPTQHYDLKKTRRNEYRFITSVQ